MALSSPARSYQKQLNWVLVLNPEEYEWSSHKAYLGHAQYTWLCKERVLSNFGSTYQESQEYLMRFIYQEFDRDLENMEISEAFSSGIFEEKDNLEQVLRPDCFKPIYMT